TVKLKRLRWRRWRNERWTQLRISIEYEGRLDGYDRPPSSSLSYPGAGANDDARSPGSGGTPGPLSQQAPASLDSSDPGNNEIIFVVSKEKFGYDERTAPMVNATGFSQSPERVYKFTTSSHKDSLRRQEHDNPQLALSPSDDSARLENVRKDTLSACLVVLVFFLSFLYKHDPIAILINAVDISENVNYPFIKRENARDEREYTLFKRGAYFWCKHRLDYGTIILWLREQETVAPTFSLQEWEKGSSDMNVQRRTNQDYNLDLCTSGEVTLRIKYLSVTVKDASYTTPLHGIFEGCHSQYEEPMNVSDRNWRRLSHDEARHQ
ncbi:Homeobox protein homothorax, partial [Cyphomyrmex costatus]